MNKFKTAFYLLSAIICMVLVVYAIYVFPIPGTDSIVFIPTAIRYSHGLGLTNPLYYVTKYTDVTHTNKFNYYVPFFPFFLGLLSKVYPGVKTVFFCCSLFSVANILLYTRAVSSFLSRNVGIIMKTIILLSVVYIATYLQPTVGRPENFTCLFIFLVYLLYHKRGQVGKGYYFILMAVLFSLMLATQLVCFYFCFLFYVIYDLINTEHIYKAILKNTLLFLCICVLFCILLQLTPNGLVNTANGILWHMQWVMGRTDRSMSAFFHYWVFAPLNFGFLAILAIAIFFFFREMYAKLQHEARIKVVLVILLIIMAAFGLIKFVIYASPTVYNATEFILPISVYLIYNINSPVARKWQKSISILLLITYLSGSGIFLRDILLFVDTQTHGNSYDEAKAKATKLVGNNKNFYATNGLWSLFDDYDRMGMRYALNKDNPGDTILIQQAYQTFPPSRDERILIYDCKRIPGRINFLGIKIAHTPYDYGFTAYRVK